MIKEEKMKNSWSGGESEGVADWYGDGFSYLHLLINSGRGNMTGERFSPPTSALTPSL